MTLFVYLLSFVHITIDVATLLFLVDSSVSRKTNSYIQGGREGGRTHVRCGGGVGYRSEGQQTGMTVDGAGVLNQYIHKPN